LESKEETNDRADKECRTDEIHLFDLLLETDVAKVALWALEKAGNRDDRQASKRQVDPEAPTTSSH
jgi:hypothetical protein